MLKILSSVFLHRVIPLDTAPAVFRRQLRVSVCEILVVFGCNTLVFGSLFLCQVACFDGHVEVEQDLSC